MEKIALTAPEVPPTNTSYKVERLTLDYKASLIYIQLLGDNGEGKSFSYSGDEAANLMIALNKANLSVKSLQRRILERVITDGLITGSISGLPD